MQPEPQDDLAHHPCNLSGAVPRVSSSPDRSVRFVSQSFAVGDDERRHPAQLSGPRSMRVQIRVQVMRVNPGAPQ